MISTKALIQSVVEGKTPQEALGTSGTFDDQIKVLQAVMEVRALANVAVNHLKLRGGQFRMAVDKLYQAANHVTDAEDTLNDQIQFSAPDGQLTDQERQKLRDLTLSVSRMEQRLMREFKV